MTEEELVLRRCVDLCEAGFAGYTSVYYEQIAIALEPFIDDSDVKRAFLLARRGKNMTSPRFAYPHIKDSLQERLIKLRNPT